MAVPHYNCINKSSKDLPMPSPSKEEMDSELFDAIWKIVKDWDIGDPNYYTGYTGGNGSHVKILLDAIKPALREDKINEILKDGTTTLPRKS